MDILWLVISVSFSLCLLVCGVSFYNTKAWFRDEEKASPYECGFDPFSSARVPFSIRFYMVAILFLVFEVESLLFFPVLSAWISGVEIGLMVWFFLLLLTVGLWYEMSSGALEWTRD